MNDLRLHPRCTQFIHDLLSLIQRDMLVIRPPDRVTSQGLLERLERILERVMDESSNDYIRVAPKYYQYEKPVTQPVVYTAPDKVHSELQKFIEKNEPDSSEQAVRATLRTLGVGPKRLPEKRSLVASPPVSYTGTRLEIEGAADTLFTQIKSIIAQSWARKATSVKRTATFKMHWELEECIRKELKGKPDLASVLTITGDSRGNSWATSYQEYVKETWGELGEKFQGSLMQFLSASFPSLPCFPFLLSLYANSMQMQILLRKETTRSLDSTGRNNPTNPGVRWKSVARAQNRKWLLQHSFSVGWLRHFVYHKAVN